MSPKNHITFYLLILSFLLALAGCSTTPTGRSQLNLMSSAQMSQMGAQSFEQIKQKMKIDTSAKNNQIVQCVSKKILSAIGENPNEWEIVIFQEDTPNAFALPGKKIGVHTGMLRIVQNQHQLAAVVGHEIGHVHAHHSNERVSQTMVVQGGLTAASIFLGSRSQSTTNKALFAALGLGAQVGVLLPFSRKHETEADRMGLVYMSKAGFSPNEAAKLWMVMQQQSGGKEPAEFFSTHPSNQSRIEDLTEYAKKLPPHRGGNPC